MLHKLVKSVKVRQHPQKCHTSMKPQILGKNAQAGRLGTFHRYHIVSGMSKNKDGMSKNKDRMSKNKDRMYKNKQV